MEGPDQPVGPGLVHGCERDRDVRQDLGVDASEADDGDGAEPWVTTRADEQLDAVAQS